MAAGEVLAITTCVRRGVYSETHAKHWFVNFKSRKSNGIVDRCDGVAYFYFFDARQNEQVSSNNFGCIRSLNARELKEAAELALQNRSSICFCWFLTNSNVFTLTQYTGNNATDRQTSEVVRGIQVGHHCLQRCSCIIFRCWNVLNNCIEQRTQIGVHWRHAEALHCTAFASNCGIHRE